MRTVRRILIAVKDPRAKALPSITKGTQLARAWGAQVELFHGLADPLYIDPLGNDYRALAREMRTERLNQLESIAKRMREQGVKVSTAVEWDFPVYEAITRRAARIKADLIIAECQPGRRIAPMLLRLTDWELLRSSPIPVLLVKSARPYRRPAVLAALDPAHTHAKPSKLDEDILKAGEALQQALRGTLHAVHAYAPLAMMTTPDELLSADLLAKMQERAEAHARKAFTHALRQTGIPQKRRHFVARHPQEAIEETARAIRSAIVVMGAVSRSGLKRIFIGNTAERLLDDLSCDVLVVKPRRFPNRVARTKRGFRLITAPSVLQPF